MKLSLYHLGRLGLILGCLICTVASLHFSAYRFGAFDLAPLIDSGWRVFSGQVPGRDFVCTVPPSLYLFTDALFHHFGVNWHSLSVGGVILFAAFTLLGLRVAGLLRSILGNSQAFFISCIYAITQIIPLLSINYPWHAWMAQSLACYAILTVVVLLKWKARWDIDSAPAWLLIELFFHLTLAFTGLLLSKPNVAYPALLLCIFVLVRAQIPKWFAISTTLVAFLTSCLLLATVHVSFPAMLASYSGLAGRALPTQLFVGIFFNITVLEGMAAIPTFAVIAPLFFLMTTLYWHNRKGMLSRPFDLLALGSFCIACIGFCTNGDTKLTDTPLLLLGAVLIVTVGSFSCGTLRFRLVCTSLGLLFLASFACVSRQRMQTIGMWAGDGCGPRVVIRDSFFGVFHNCPVFASVLQESDRAVAATAPGQRVFFGPDLEFLYARDRIASPKHLPLWWHPGTSYAVKQTDQIDRAWIDDRFDTLIFVHSTPDNTPQAILDAIGENYVQIPGYNLIDVYKVRSTQSPNHP